jgi:endonuclease YncB( thermonuclease family)
MASWRDACLIAAFAAGFAAIGGETPARAEDPASTRHGQVCGGNEIARGTVGKIVDGRTFVLEDGREVRLAAIEVAPLAGPPDRADPAGRAAAAALDALAAGDQVVLRRAESESDRYGRLFAYAYTLREGDEFLLQRELVAEGFARVSNRIASPCAGHLLDREKAAREAKLGLWADPYYEVLNAETSKDALAYRGRFALVEGKVASRKRADNLREFRPAADWGHYGYDPETKRAQFRGGGF